MNATDLRWRINEARDRLPTPGSTSVEVVHLAQCVGIVFSKLNREPK